MFGRTTEQYRKVIAEHVVELEGTTHTEVGSRQRDGEGRAEWMVVWDNSENPLVLSNRTELCVDSSDNKKVELLHSDEQFCLS